MVKGFSFGVGIFAFIAMSFCLAIAMKCAETNDDSNMWINVILAIINGGLAIINMVIAFA